MTDPIVSVITPAFDVGPWITDALDSVRAQTETRFEHLVVDDGSTDDTAAIVAARATADPRVRLVSVPKAGSGAARNTGLAATTAPFVAFLDGDDRWHPDFLRRQLAAFARVPRHVGAVYCHTRVMLPGGQVVALRWQPAGRCDLDLLLAANCPPHHGSSLVLRRSCFDEAGLFDTTMRSAVDFDMWLRIATGSSTPLFWGQRRYLVDMRLGRSGAVSADRGARYRALDGLLEAYAPRMRRLPPGLAYLRPAVFAYRDGFDDHGDAWAGRALSVGARRLATTAYGPTLLSWHAAGASGRAVLRAGRDRARSGVYRGLAAAQRRRG